MRLRSTVTLAALVAASAMSALTLAPAASAAPNIGVGASVLDPRLGSNLIERTFDDRIGRTPTNRRVNETFNVWDEPAVRAWVRKARAGSEVDYFHEPEDQIEHHALTADVWAARTVRVAEIIREEHRVGEITTAPTFMRWSLDPHSGRTAMMRSLLRPSVVAAVKSVHGYMGIDSYAGKRSASLGPQRSPDDMYGVPARYAAHLGLRWGVQETGARQNQHSNPVRAAAWWRSAFAYVSGGKVSPPVVFLGWNPTDKNGGEFALQRFPKTAEVWRLAAQRL